MGLDRESEARGSWGPGEILITFSDIWESDGGGVVSPWKMRRITKKVYQRKYLY